MNIIADAVQKVRVTVTSLTLLKALFSRTPPIIGPIARARLAPDCIIPNDVPCLCSGETFDPKLVSEGEANALPIENTAVTIRSQVMPPVPPQALALRLSRKPYPKGAN